ncbi:hypothetical protein [Qipengyuania huizhouensis]|uniref:hypothetical protein n=1 Tax=Qipengyuania huizhouensis TaxID=2867245 RepID=UPI001C87C2F7|nr:hypothetical protein [Qipengyuania huizhouensis]MBX7459538.1 hypothetical protein [Qipengyuania huizhouensis]
MSALAYLESALAGDRADPLCALRREVAEAGLSARAFARLLELGIPAKALAQLCGAGDVAATRVALSRDGSRYEPEGPDARLLLTVREQGVPVDIVALATHDEDQWALRRGEGWCLGYDAWLRCETGFAHELRVHATPLAWLRGGCEGVAILEWDLGLRMLRGLGENVLLRCDRGAGERLKALLRVGGLPRVKETGTLPIRRAA